MSAEEKKHETSPLGLKERIEYNKTYKPDYHDPDEQLDGYQLKWVGKEFAHLLAGTATETVLYPDEKHNSQTENANSQNIFLTGDNIESLKHLQNCYKGAVKMIYIDPPYNTGNDGFIYNDKRNFTDKVLKEQFGYTDADINRLRYLEGSASHSAWLTFMYPRLKLAKELLRDDGVIFISIDDNEQANLKLICDEIFGENNFVYNLSVVNSLNGNDNSSGMIETQESCFIFSKNKANFETGELPIEEDSSWQIDEKGYWKEGGSLKATGQDADRVNRPNLYFPIWINRQNLEFSIYEETGGEWYCLLPTTGGREKRWYWNKKKFEKDKDEVIVKQTKGGFSLYKKQRPSLGSLPTKKGKTTFYSPKYSSANAENALTVNLFNKEKLFSYPKSVDLITDLILLGVKKNSAKIDDEAPPIILDFFSGSATTAHAVMALNAEDRGNRRYILCQLDETTQKNKDGKSEETEASKAGYKTIDEIARERIKRAAKQLGDTSGFKHYYVKQPEANTLNRITEFTPEKQGFLEEDMLAAFDKPEVETKGEQTILATWLAADGYKFTDSVETITLAGFRAHKIDTRLYIIAKGWGSAQTKELLNQINTLKLNVNSLILYGYSFTLPDLRELESNIKTASVDDSGIEIERRY